MKTFVLMCVAAFGMTAAPWEPDFANAMKKAKENHCLVLLNFSGSDWCIPCIRMRKDIFDSPEFTNLADTLLVCYNADFPRKKKNELSLRLRQQNDSLAAIYNPQGKFPFTLLLSADGKVVHTWDGYPDGRLPAFTTAIKNASHVYPR